MALLLPPPSSSSAATLLTSHSSPSLCKTSLPSTLLSPPPPLPGSCATSSITSLTNRGTRRRPHLSSSASLTNTGSATTAAAESPPEPGENRTRLTAQNIPWTCTREDIRSLFEKYGTVTDVELSMYNSTRNRGLTFVSMASEEEALAALNNLNSSELDGRVIGVEFARTLKKKPSTVMADPVTKYNVFVGNLTLRVRSRDLRELFSASNPNLLSAEVIFQSNPRRSACYGFVSFGSKEEAEAAVSAFNGKKFMGRAIRLVLGKIQTGDSGRESNGAEQFDDKSSKIKDGGEP